MAENTTYPPIEPTTYDLIVVGTGLPESIIAAAASTAGKSVVHLDPNSFYGSHYSSLTLNELTAFLTSQSSTTTTTTAATLTDGDGDGDYTTVELQTRPMYSDVEIASHSPDILNEHPRKFSIDVAGPRVLYCADSSIDFMLKSGASNYVEFKSVDASFVRDDANGNLSKVLDSTKAIFKDRSSLSLREKTQLGRFFKIVEQHLAASAAGDVSRISEKDLESPFVDYLNQMQLPQKIKSAILYAIAMADYDQNNAEEVLKTKDGIDRLALYNQSVGRFSNALGALIYPIYGQGELPQAFCRRAAVKGCLYVLRMPVIAMLLDKGGGHYKGVRLASGQDIFSHQLLLDPSYVVPLTLASPPSIFSHESPRKISREKFKGKVARGICITRSSLVPNVLSLLMICPPRSLYPEQATSIRVLQIGSNIAVCPSGMFVLYLSALCDDTNEGKKLLHVAMDALFSQHDSGEPGISSSAQSENTEELKPSLLWSALYIQELSMGSFEVVGSSFMPDGSLNYDRTLHATIELFQKMYPGEEFFPEAANHENSEEECGLSLES